jgi:hypothetical protein
MGWDASPPRENDYVILDDTVVVGPVYRELIQGEPKWRWFLQTVPATPPKTAFKHRHERASCVLKRKHREPAFLPRPPRAFVQRRFQKLQ